MIVAIFAALLVLFWGVAYLWLAHLAGPGQTALPAGLTACAGRLSQDLDDMFLPVSRGAVLAVLLGLFGAGALTGFLLPGAAVGLERLAIDRAMAFNRAGNYPAAQAELSRYKDSASALTHNELGVAYHGTGNMELAEKEFLRALEIKPHYAKAQANLAALRGLQGDEQAQAFEEARARQDEALPLDSQDLYPKSTGLTEDLAQRLIGALSLGLAFAQLPRMVVGLLRRRRIRRFEAQLAEGLVMAANALRAGFSLLQALDLTATRSQAPLSQEFGLALKEHRLGADLGEALRRLARRIPTADTLIFVNSVNILRETGGNLTEIFDTLAETIQERKQVQTKLKTMTAEGVAQAWFLAALPVVLGFVLYQLNPESMSLFFTTFGGWVMLLAMGLMEIVGVALMLKIVRIKV